MVFFTCNACGQAVKKNQVEKHYKIQCRNCQVLSCMDCGKDFPGDEYMGHTKCVSENEKYGGKDYKAKPNSNKGEAKQEEWITRIQNTIDTTKVRPALSSLLKQLMTFNNIPRNEVKFQKFLENSFRVRDIALIKESWAIFNKAKEKSKNVPSNEKGSVESSSETANNDSTKNKRPKKVDCNNSENHCSEEKSEELMTKKHKKSKKNKDLNNHINKENEKDSKECSNDSINSLSVEQKLSKKHKKGKKNKDIGNETVQEENTKVNMSVESNLEDSSIISNNDDSNAKKFNWKKVIKAILKNASDNEISLKKLQKKVLAEFYARGGEKRPMDENELRATFRKKVTSNPKFKVHKERVKLVS